jgi:hypothetical protein
MASDANQEAKREGPRGKTGPKPERLKLKGDWQGLVGKALAKNRPAKGWPKQKKGKP